MSGNPVMAPVESGQSRISSIVLSSAAEVPTIATSFWHAWISASRVCAGLTCES